MSTRVIDSKLAMIAVQRFQFDPLTRLKFSSVEEFYEELERTFLSAQTLAGKAKETPSPNYEKKATEVNRIFPNKSDLAEETIERSRR